MAKSNAKLLRVLFRVVGSVALLAVIAVVMPYSWMDTIHRSLGMGALPDEPIVGYLARSTSAFYAIIGGLLWVFSLDPERYRSAICYLGWVFVALGVILFVVDLLEGLPRYWVIGEGPINVFFGVLVLLLVRGFEKPS